MRYKVILGHYSGEKKEVVTIKDFARQYRLPYSKIWQVIHFELESYGGWSVVYSEEPAVVDRSILKALFQ
jgi:hypothetical protein